MPVPKKEQRSGPSGMRLAKGVLIGLLLTIILAIILSIIVIYSSTHNLTGSIYYTLSSMLGTNEEGYSTIIFAQIPEYSYAFYAVVAVLAIDGIIKYMLIGFGVALLLEVLSGVDIQSKLLNLTTSRLSNHVVVCGYSALAERLSDQLKEKSTKFVILEKDTEKMDEIREDGFAPIIGDFTNIDDLKAVNAQKASHIIFCGENDYVNLLGVLAARRLSNELNIVCRARDESAVTKMQRAGADLCIIPELVAGLELGQKLSGV